MAKLSIAFIYVCILFCESKAQDQVNKTPSFQSQSFGIHGGLSLLENPFVLYPAVYLSYSKTIAGKKQHQLAILPQLGAIILPAIETKFLMSASLQYKYISRKRLEANVFLGTNFQLRRLAYNRYQFEDNRLQNKGKLLYQVGPTMGVSVGYKVIKKTNFSISPITVISLTKLNKNYQPDFFAGYKPSVTFGFTLSN